MLPKRLASIDVLRAITMLLMIFVNDLWSLQNIPKWLLHTKAEEDGMGFSDIIFPAFLFIVGLSLPFAIGNRQAKGETTAQTLAHIAMRTAALLIMGVFHVNLESYNHALALLPKPVWQIGITIGFFMVWLDYDKWEMAKNKRLIFQIAGMALLALLAALYTGGKAEAPTWLRTQWWGILGLIGWAYLPAALCTLFLGKRLLYCLLAWLCFMVFNIAAHAGWLNALSGIKAWIWPAGNGAMAALALGGVCVSVLYRYALQKNKTSQYIGWLLAIASVMLIAGFALRPIEGISKIKATPSWVLICSAITACAFALLIWLVDVRKKQGWFSVIRPAGSSTLTCYLLPYIHYAVLNMVGLSLPLWMRTGALGLAKSFAYALIIVVITGWLERKKLRLKI